MKTPVQIVMRRRLVSVLEPQIIPADAWESPMPPEVIENVFGVSDELAEGFVCGPFDGQISELVALGKIPCPGCGLFVHAARRVA
jgi:hypothetical protein